MTPIAPHISAWLQVRLPVERAASPHTCDTYAYAFQLFFDFAARRLGLAPSDLMIEHLDAPMVQAFLEYLQRERGNGPRTRNARLAAIRSFMRFVEHRVPAALNQIRSVRAIPMQKSDTRVVRHLTKEETQAILDAPDPKTRLGTRDRALLHLGLTSGMRVSELVGLVLSEISFRDNYLDIHIRGKGRKHRVLTLWKSVADSMRAWLALRTASEVPEVFTNARGEALTRSGAEYILTKYTRLAVESCPSLKEKRVSPHVMRHTCALTVLQATKDLRKVALWLGHNQIQTTEKYLQVDPTEKIELLESVVPPGLKRGSFSPPDKLLDSLRKR